MTSKPTLEELNEKMKRSGGSLDLRDTQITAEERAKVKNLHNGDQTDAWVYADGILTHIKASKTANGYTYFRGKIPGKNVVTDGKNWAHCKTFREGVADLALKAEEDRGADQYRGIDLDTELTPDEAVTMYRIITGACRAGSAAFVESLGELKEKYTVREMLKLTKGQYGHDRLAEFLEVEDGTEA